MSWPNQQWPSASQKVPYILAQSNVPIGPANTGTVTGSSTGNLVLGTALDQTYGPTSNNIPGIWLYFPSTAFSTAAAGWYWCVMTNTTTGTVYNSVYTAPGMPGLGSTAAGIVTGSGSQYAQATGSYTASLVALVPGNSIGPNGHLRVTAQFSNNNTGNNKLARTFVYTTTAIASGVGAQLGTETSNVNQMHILKFFNLGVTNSNAFVAVGAVVLQSGTALQLVSYDTTQSIYIGPCLQVATATDWIICMNYCIEVLPS